MVPILNTRRAAWRPGTKAVAPASNRIGTGELFSALKATGEVSGVVNISGWAAAPEQVDLSGSTDCLQHRGAPLYKEDVLAKDGKLANVVVYVKSGFEKWSFEPTPLPVTLNQKGCQYAPHVIAMMVGQPLEVGNDDPFYHNVHARSLSNTEFNLNQPTAGATETRIFHTAEMGVRFTCDVHKWMVAYGNIFAHPFFAVTGADGKFTLKLPPGEYELGTWHESSMDGSHAKLLAPASVEDRRQRHAHAAGFRIQGCAPRMSTATYHRGIHRLAQCLTAWTFLVVTLSWGTNALGYSRSKFLVIQLIGICFFALFIPVSALLAERGRRRVMLGVTVAIGIFGLVLAPLFTAGTAGAVSMMILGLSLMGLTYGPLGTVISELFPTRVRYTGSSLAFSFAGILGASLAPYIATWLARHYGLQYVGYYLSAAALLTLVGLLSIRETKDDDLATSNI